MINFLQLTDEQLFSIWKSTNVYEWNDLLGEKPKDFDRLPKYRYRRTKHAKKVKSDYTHPIWAIVDYLLPDSKKQEFIAQERKLHFSEISSEISEVEIFSCLMEVAPCKISDKEKQTVMEYFAEKQGKQ